MPLAAIAVQLTVVPGDCLEGDGAPLPCTAFARLDQATDVAVSGRFHTVAASTGPQATPDVDYARREAVDWSIAPGEVEGRLLLLILPDDIDEGDEWLGVQITDVNNAMVAVDRADYRIIDDDHFAAASVADLIADEPQPAGSSQVLFDVQLDRPAPEALQIDWNTSDGSAVAGEDYVAAIGTLNFTTGQQFAQVAVQLLGDAQAEGFEQFALRLRAGTGYVLADGRGDALIQDNGLPGGRLTLSESGPIEVPEGASVSISVLRSISNSGAVTVQVRAEEGSAEPGLDYVDAIRLVSYADQQQGLQSVSFSTIDDQEIEGTEEFEIYLDNATGGASPGLPYFLTVRIIDDDERLLADSFEG
ncbi:MAG: hypothetical protein KDI51_08465 [Xanthomonadales bacterium]|nr:hypothetical protein [Xanthomonadales bacterium]